MTDEAQRDYYFSHKTLFKEANIKQRFLLRKEVLTAYGGEHPSCSCCKEDMFDFLTIHHQNNGGKQQRTTLVRSESNFFTWLKANGFPENLGLCVMCYNCNESIEHYGYCPHQKEREEDALEKPVR